MDPRGLRANRGDGTYRDLFVGSDGSLQVDVQGRAGGQPVISETVRRTSLSRQAAPADVVGDVLSYTPPAGKSATVVGMSKIDRVGSTAVITVETDVGGGTQIRVDRYGAGISEHRPMGLVLQAGHIAIFRVTTVGATGDTVDLHISAWEQL